jgi:hypothetical protein
MSFFLLLKIIFSSLKTKLSDVNKTYINVSNEQKFELKLKKKTVAFSGKLNIVFAMRVFVRETD